MKPAFEDMNLQIPAVTAEPEDYTGEDGLLYCGKCRTPKEAYFPADKATLFGRDRHPAECDCKRHWEHYHNGHNDSVILKPEPC